MLVLALALSLLPSMPPVFPPFDQVLTRDAFSTLSNIGGRALTPDGVILVGAESHLLLTLSLWSPQGTTLERTVIKGLLADDSLSGLASMSDGTFLSVLNLQQLVRITTSGDLEAIGQLPLPVFSLHRWGERLLAPAARTQTELSPLGVLSTDSWTPVGVLRTRPGKSRLAAMVRNLTHCGASRGQLFPCWFLVGNPEVSLAAADGTWHTPTLAVQEWSSRSFPGLDDLPISFRDIFVTADGEILTLSDTRADVSRLDRYTENGVLLGSRRTTTKAKLFLDAHGEQVFLLMDNNRMAVLEQP